MQRTVLPMGRSWGRRAVRAAVAAACAAGWLAWTVEPHAQTPDFQRVVAIADVHGALGSFERILRAADLVDAEGQWAAGETIFVQTGDTTDRGIEVRAVLDRLMALESQAQAAGGRVVALLGNHEVMNVTRFLRDVSPSAYSRFADELSETRRFQAYERYERLTERRLTDVGAEPFRVFELEAWLTAHPPGMLEYLEAFGPSGVYGQWLRSKDIVVTIGDTLFMHAGLEPDGTAASVEAVNARAREEIARFDRYTTMLVDRGVILPFFTFDETLEAARIELETWIARMQPVAAEPPELTRSDRAYLEQIIDLLQIGTWSIMVSNGPLWSRGFAQWDDVQGPAALDTLTARFGVKRFVVGHTPSAQARILPRFDHRVFLIDTGMLVPVYNGEPSALSIVGDDITAIYPTGRLLLTPARSLP